MDFRNYLFPLIESLCASAEMPPSDAFQACPANLKNCVCCLVETILSYRLKQTQDRFTELTEKFPSVLEQFSLQNEPDVSNPKTNYASKIILCLRLLSVTTNEKAKSNNEMLKDCFSGSERRLLSFAFDAFFYVEVFPLLPNGIVSSLEKRLPLDSALRLSSSYSHFPPDTSDSIRLLDRHFTSFIESLLSCQALFQEFISFQNGEHFEDLLGALAFLSESPSAKQALGGDRCLFWLKKLEEEILVKAPLHLVTRILLTNLNRCTARSCQAKQELIFASALYGRLLSKTLISNNDGVQNFLEVFMETTDTGSFEHLSRDELWKRSLAVAAVLIRCPTFAKPSEYYPIIAKQLAKLLSRSMISVKSSDSNIPPTFVAFVLGALLLQPQLFEKKNALMAGKLSKFLRLYFFPTLVEPFIKLEPNFHVSIFENSVVADLSCLANISAVLNAIPETVWSHLDLGDIHFFLRSFSTITLEIWSAFYENTLLSGQVTPLCQNILSRFFSAFPVVPNSQSADILADWLTRPVLPMQYEFERPLVMSTEASPFEFRIVEREVSLLDIEARLNSIRSLLRSFERSSYICAIWSLLLSNLRRLLLFLENKHDQNEALSLSYLYTLLGSLSEEVAEFSETELSNLMMAPERFNVLIEFVGVLCDRLLILPESESEDAKVCSFLESTVSLSMSIVSSVVVNKPDDAEIIANLLPLQPKLESLCECKVLSSQCQEMLKAFLAMLEPGKKSKSKLSQNVESMTIDSSLKSALSDIADPMCAIKGHGLIVARRLVLSKSQTSIAESAVSDLFRIFFQCLSHEDSYVHLNAAAALTALGLRFHQQVLPHLASLYAGRTVETLKNSRLDVDTRLRIGECLCRIIRGLGDLAPVYRAILLDSCLITAKANLGEELASTDEDEKEEIVVKLRSSALSTLGQLAGALRFSLASNSGEVLVCMSGFLASRSEHLEVHRAAACSLVLLLRGFGDDRSQIFHLSDILRDVGRILRQNKTSCLDDILLLHIDLGLAEIDRLGRLLLEPEHELRNLIKKPVSEL